MDKYSLETKLSVENDVFVVSFEGRLDIFTFKKCRDYLQGLYVGRKGVKIITNLEKVSHAASSGWAILVATAKTMERLEGKFAIYGLGEDTERVYDTMRLKTTLPRFKTKDEALDFVLK